MGVFTFVCRSSGGQWTGKQYSGDLESSAPSTFELQRKLVQTVLSADSSGGVQSSFSHISPDSAVFQVIVGGGGGGGGFASGGAAPASGGGAAPAAQEAAAEKKEEKVEESDEEEFGLSLFD